ncbi:hypothetical protein KKI23_00915 [Patescibacteria group bacterium]|nr:hypothetical protein [Patescibacteria group bacterium]
MNIISSIRKWRQPKQSIYQQIAKTCLYLLAFFLPLLAVPLAQDYLEISKTVLLYFLITIASLACLLHIVVSKELKVEKNKFNLFVLIFLLTYILATAFSLNWRISLIGLAGYYSDSLVTIIFLIALFLVVRNTFSSKKDFLNLFYSLLASGLLIAIFSIFQFGGLYLFSQEITQQAGFNLLANSVSVFTLFLGLIIPLILFLLLINKKLSIRIPLLVLGVIALLLLMVFDVQVGWFSLVVGLFIFLVLISWHSKQIATVWVITPTILIIVAILFIFISFDSLFGLSVESDVVFGQSNSWQVTGQVLKSRFLTGSGPNTFHYDLNLYRPLSFNNHPFWSLSFVKANSQWSQAVTTLGLLNIISLLIIAWFWLKNGFKKVFSQKLSDDWYIDAMILTVWLTLFVSGFIYSYNIVLNFIFWLFLGLGAVRFFSSQKETVSLAKNQIKNLLMSVGFGVWAVIAITVLVFAGRFYGAEYYSNQAQESVTNFSDIKEVENYFIKATNLNPLSAENRFNLAESYLVEAGLMVNQGNVEVDQQIKNAAALVNQAVKLEQESVPSLLRKAIIYRDFRQFVTDTEDIVFSNLTWSKEKSPNDPIIFFESGRSYLLYVQDIIDDEEQSTTAQDYLQKAETDLDQSLKLRVDLIEARMLLVQVYDWQGQLAEDENKEFIRVKMITELETILLYDPTNQSVIDFLAEIKKETS